MKPIKNNKRIDPRYFLDETAHRFKQRIHEVGAYLADTEGGAQSGGESSERTSISYDSKETEQRFKAFEEALKYMGYNKTAGSEMQMSKFSIYEVSAEVGTGDTERAYQRGSRPEETSGESKVKAVSTQEHHYEIDPAKNELVAQNLMQTGFKPGPDGKISSPVRYISVFGYEGSGHEAAEREHFLRQRLASIARDGRPSRTK
jgi:hypothetical protein